MPAGRKLTWVMNLVHTEQVVLRVLVHAPLE
jgi:hypothetical protein